ncbi:uncharacterized protein RCO7_15012 [Rhynchosporium graminicola]|uniref:Uncharacterized protein n=1 Tax=Rhynchosporium graminicola TaxID=2792576 RepID=A0A1E1LF95_9HELO|nr:uncharacterized protein RCO7_15012 [Rhynchosporium commune]
MIELLNLRVPKPECFPSLQDACGQRGMPFISCSGLRRAAGIDPLSMNQEALAQDIQHSIIVLSDMAIQNIGNLTIGDNLLHRLSLLVLLTSVLGLKPEDAQLNCYLEFAIGDHRHSIA